jgi:hypothetical protein
MPHGSKVESCYQKVKKQGHSEGSAARICQAATGEALQTGKPPKGKSMKDIRAKYHKKIGEWK